MQDLTKAEEQIMQLLWDLEEAVVKNIIEKMPEPKPAYNTVSTFIRILEKKGFVGHRAEGKRYIYFPLISKNKYRRHALKNVIQGYFGGSYKDAVSFFVKEDELEASEIENLLNQIREANDD